MGRMGTNRFSTELNILIVDDDPDTCQLLNMLFSAKGYNTTVVYCGKDALPWVEIGKADVVVLDVMMPDMDGLETYQHVRELSTIPVLILTVLSSGECAARGLEIGFNDYMRKPFRNEELLARVKAMLTNPRNTYPFLC